MTEKVDWSSFEVIDAPSPAAENAPQSGPVDWSSFEVVGPEEKPKTSTEGGGFFASAKQSIGSAIKGAGQLAADLPGIDEDNVLMRYGQSIVEANQPAIRSLEDISDKPLTAVKEAAGSAVGSIGGMAGARALGMGITAAAPFTGPAAPVTALIGQAVSWLGPMAIAALPSYGSIREKQILNDPQNIEDFKSKAIAAMGSATVGAIETKFGPQNWALGAMTKEGRDAIAKKFAETTLAKAIGFGAAKGAAIEGAEEIVQSPVEQIASYEDPTVAKSLRETAFGGAMGAIGGGVFGGAAGVAFRGQPTTADIGKAQSVDEAIATASASVESQPTPTAAAPTIAELERAAGIATPEQIAELPTAAPDIQPEPTTPELTDIIKRGATREEIFAQRESELAAQEALTRETGIRQLVEAGRDLQLEQAAALTKAQGFGETEPTAIQLAMQQAQARRQLLTTPVSQRMEAAQARADQLIARPKITRPAAISQAATSIPEPINVAPTLAAAVPVRNVSATGAIQAAPERVNIERVSAPIVQPAPAGLPDTGVISPAARISVPGADEGVQQPAAVNKRQESIASLESMTGKQLRGIAANEKRAYMRNAAAEILQTRSQETRQKRSELAKKIYVKSKQIDPDRDTMAQAIAKLGGINSESATGRMRLAPEELNIRGHGVLRVFNKTGRSMDEIGAQLADLGYVQHDANGKYDQTDFEDKLAEVAGGAEVLTPNGMMQRAQENQEQAMREVGATSSEEYAAIESDIEQVPDDVQKFIDDAFDNTQLQRALSDEEIDRLFEPTGGNIPEVAATGQAREGDQRDQAPPAGSAKKVSEDRLNLIAIAERIGVSVNEVSGGFHAGGGVIDIPQEDAQVESAVTPNHVLAHELGHAIMQKRQFSFSGFPKTEMLKWIANYDDLVKASKEFRPGVHGNENAQYRRHAMKPNEIIADAIGAVLIGEKPISLIQPMMLKTGITERDLGLPESFLQSESEAEANARLAEAKEKTRLADLELKRLDEVEKHAKIQKEIDRRQAASAERFELGRTAEEAISGQEPLFSKAPGDEYRGEHTAPDSESGTPAHDLTSNGIYPDDVYSINGPRYYGDGSALDAESFRVINSLRGKPNASVKIYRAVPIIASRDEKISKLEKQKSQYLKRKTIPSDSGFRTGSAWYEWASNELDRLQALPEELPSAPLSINDGDWVTINRQYAKDHGESALGGEFKIISKTVKAREIFTNGDPIHEWGYSPAEARQSRGRGTSSIVKAWQALAQLDAIFKYPKSDSKDIFEIFGTVAPDIAIERNDRAMPGDMKNAWNIYPKDASGRPDKSRNGWVLQYKDGKVEINVANFATGDFGSQVYAAVGNYAYNNDLLFAGDRFGVSEDAMYRRLENLTSLALKFGSTDFIALHPDQIDRFGIDWKDDDTTHNIGEMLKASFNHVAETTPEIKEIIYDFDTSEFKDISSGLEYDERGIERISENARARGFRGGSATFKRAILTNTFLQGPTRTIQRSLLQKISEFGGKPLDEALVGLAYSRGEGRRIAGISAAELSKATARLRAKWLGFTKVNTVQSVNDLPSEILDRVKPDAQTEGFYDPQTQSVYLIADNITSPERAAWVSIHEVQGHGGLRMLKDKTVTDAVNIASANKFVRELSTAIAKDRGGLAQNIAIEESISELAAAIETNDFQAFTDRYGVTVPDSAKNGIRGTIARVIDAVKRFLASVTGKPVADVSDADVRSLIAAQREAVETTPTEANGSLASIDAEQEALFSKASFGTLDPAQEAAAERVLGKPKTLGQRLDEFKKNWQKSIVQGVFDQFAPIKELSEKAYIQARMSRGGDSTLEALMMYGKIKVDKDGFYEVDYQKAGGKQGFAQAMAKLKGEHDRFFLWVAAHRAESLASVGLENLFSQSDIAALKTLSRGQMKDGTNRAPLYMQAMKDLNDFNDSVLKIAVDSGLIDDATRQMYKNTPYIPFYRLQEEGIAGFGMKAGLVNQSAWKKLKGGTEKLNEDLMANLLQNWSHLITASAKNRAAKASLDAAVNAGVAAQVPSGAPGKGTVSYREAGKDKTFLVSDPHIMDAITALEYAGLGPWAKPLTTMKRMLTIGVTANPAFKIRNLIRDSVQAIGTADLSYNPLSNIRSGWMATADDSEIRAQMLASGGMIRFGSMLEGNSSQRAKDLINHDIDPAMVLDDDNKVKAFWKGNIQPAIDAYQELGDRGEQVNRAALYQRLLDKGMSHGEASFWARDLMDFSSTGKWQAVRFLTQVVPFMNARLQGLYKLGRASKQDIRRMGYVTGVVALASIALMAAYKDDDDWKKREDWDRQNYWWFKVGDTAFRIPKPFEIGSIGTIAEMGIEYFSSDEMTGKRFVENIGAIVGSQLSMNPIPQLVKPMLDVYANKDSFTKRPIESLAMQRLKPSERYSERTSEVGRFLGSLGLPDPAMLMMGHYEELSPVKIDALTRGYFSWLGVMATTAIDYGIRPMMDRGERPAMQLKDVFVAGNFAESLPSNSSRYVSQMYDQANAIEQAYASYQQAIKQGDIGKAKSLLAENRKEIMAYKNIAAIKRRESEINAQINKITSSKTMGADEKRRLIDVLSAKRDQVARMIMR